MSQKLTPGFVVAHSHRLEDLTTVAMQFMSRYPLGPLAEDTVLVQSNGIAQWLKINLAQSNGIATMLNVSLPARFVWQAYRAVLGNQIPKTSPFDKDRLVWRIMRILPGLVTEAKSVSFKEIANYLKDAEAGTDQRKLYQLSHRIADLFDQYQNYRADWLDHWSHGRDCLDHETDSLPASDLWQPQLWRALVQDIGSEQQWTNRAALHRAFVVKAKSLTECPAGMPARVVVFGISSLPQQSLEVLDAIKGFTQVVLCVHNPCKHYWANIVDGKEALKSVLKELKTDQRRHHLKSDMTEEVADDELHHYAHPLLASWGKQGRDYIHLLDLYDETLQKQESFAAIKFELFDETEPTNLLQQLQNDILHLRPLHETQSQWPAVALNDRSIQFHSCHSVQREIEVLHDQILQAFAEDNALRPQDIMVMVPDVNVYSPHIEAVFGRFQRVSEHPGSKQRHIPFTIADQGQRNQQPLLVALELLLEIDQARITQTDVLSLLAIPAVQARFDLTAQEIVEIENWCNAAGARWGLEPEHREQFGMPTDLLSNSWWFALERMIFGYMMGRPDSTPYSAPANRWHNIEPYHEVAGLAASAVGKLADFIAELNRWWRDSRQERRLSEWSVKAEQLLDAFFMPQNDEDTLCLGRLRAELGQLLEHTGESNFEIPVRLTIFCEAWLSRLDRPQLHQRFLAGAVNFATLMPMRAIPFKHIFVLGMNDDAYPRPQSHADFDLMSNRYRPGDRARREDDCYLFLEALLSARQRFSISWLGHSAQDNSEWPASVLVAQLREHLAHGWQLAGAGQTASAEPEKSPLLSHMTTQHKLQAFNLAYFQPNNVGLFTYASEWLKAIGQTESKAATSAIPSWQLEEGERLYLTANNLDKFLREAAHPFFTLRLGTYFSTDDTQTHDSETFATDGLTSWQFRTELLEHSMACLRNQMDLANGRDESSSNNISYQLERMQREGRLGIAGVAGQIKRDLTEKIELEMTYVKNVLTAFPVPVNDCALKVDGEQWVIEDHATQLFKSEQGEILQLLVSASSKKEEYLFYPYVKHLLLSIIAGRQGLGAVTTEIIFSKEKNKDKPVSCKFPPLSDYKALELLTKLMADYHQALQAPVPVVGKLAMVWLNTYYDEISGKPKNEDEKVDEEVQNKLAQYNANLAVKKELESDQTSPPNDWPYASRVALADLFDENTFENAGFEKAMLKRYAPIVRLIKGQIPDFELPDADKNGEDA